jgi:hypothetical protein
MCDTFVGCPPGLTRGWFIYFVGNIVNRDFLQKHYSSRKRRNNIIHDSRLFCFTKVQKYYNFRKNTIHKSREFWNNCKPRKRENITELVCFLSHFTPLFITFQKVCQNYQNTIKVYLIYQNAIGFLVGKNMKLVKFTSLSLGYFGPFDFGLLIINGLSTQNWNP